MRSTRRDVCRLAALGLAGTVLAPAFARAAQGAAFDIKSFGATGDGTTIDSDAINRAIDAASAGGGGTVGISPGHYASHSIRLKARSGSTSSTGRRAGRAGARLRPGGNKAPWNAYQDFGHSHWHNSLIWGENVEDAASRGAAASTGAG